MIFDVEGYMKEFANRFETDNAHIRLEHLSSSGYMKEDGSIDFPQDEKLKNEFLIKILSDPRLKNPSFTKEELESYFVNDEDKKDKKD